MGRPPSPDESPLSPPARRSRHEPEPADLLCLTLDDNGAGLPAGDPQGGQGLNNMRLRAQAIGAQLTLGASPEGGVRVALQLPLQVPPT